MPTLFDEITTNDDQNCQAGTISWSQITYSWFTVETNQFRVSSSDFSIATDTYRVTLTTQFICAGTSFSQDFQIKIQITNPCETDNYLLTPTISESSIVVEFFSPTNSIIIQALTAYDSPENPVCGQRDFYLDLTIGTTLEPSDAYLSPIDET